MHDSCQLAFRHASRMSFAMPNSRHAVRMSGYSVSQQRIKTSLVLHVSFACTPRNSCAVRGAYRIWEDTGPSHMQIGMPD